MIDLGIIYLCFFHFMLVIEEVVAIDDVHARHLDVSLCTSFPGRGDLFEAPLFARLGSGDMHSSEDVSLCTITFFI